MKRFNKTAIAIALSGALALGVAPAADAQEAPGAPAATVNHEGATWYLHSNGQFYVNDAALVFTPADQIKDDAKIGLDAVNAEGEEVAPAADEQALPLPAEITIDGATWYLHNDKIHYVKNRDQWNTPVTEIAEGDKIAIGDIDAAGEVEGDQTQGDATEGSSSDTELTPGQIAGIVAGVLAGTLVIGGVVYKLVMDKNGKPVYVPEDKAGKEPSAEDKAASDKMISENADEIKRQTATAEKMGEEVVKVEGDAAGADSERGVNAETGNNTIAKGLVGLLIASIMGAAIFAFGRRRLV
ncbi:hypothetical protein [Corynebacterium sp. p3-SID1194]|uniref:hypothetical protein n=1 Tax=Corynebacterium sp. p3-SID1194 TaxID=2916105 RepID=UPI0021A84E52|nr:hypothetical protein [Corynebacterium sp. p3-SID1194]MCT1450910.1 hypothetical protein [Corynebacterium sp. p3-SID1194]